jgi:hypothetical protein
MGRIRSDSIAHHAGTEALTITPHLAGRIDHSVVEWLEFADALGFDPRSAIRRISAVKG